MFRAYFDRSELGNPARVMAVSGYLSPDDEWQQFEASWLDVLRAHGVDMFHMTEFECRKAAFEFWTDQTRIEFLGQLIGLIARHAVVGVGAATF